MASSWGQAWGTSWGNSWGATAAVILEGGGVSWPPQWWLQHREPPLGTQPARASGDEIEIYAEFDPGYATGKARATARRITRKAEFDAGAGLGFALAGDASAVVIPAKTVGSHVTVTAEISNGRASAAGIAQGQILDLAAKLITRPSRGHAVASGFDIECQQFTRPGRTRGYAVANGAASDRPSHFISGKARGGFAFDLAALDNDLLMIAA